MRTFQQLFKVVVSHIQRDRQPNGTPQTIPSPNPIPELEHILFGDSKLRDSLRIRAECDKVLGDVCLIFGVREEPRPGAFGICDRLLRSKRLTCDDEQGCLRITFPKRLGYMRPVDVGYEVRGQIPLGVLLQGFRHHDRAEVGTSNTDVHNGFNSFPRVPLPFPTSHGVRELFDMGQYPTDLVYTTFLNLEIVVEVAKGNMKNCTVLRGVDMFTCEHLVAHGLDISLADKRQEGVENWLRDKIFGVIE